MLEARRALMKMAPVLVFGAGTNWAAGRVLMNCDGWETMAGVDEPAPSLVPKHRVQRDPAALGATACFLRARARLPKQQQLRVQLLPGAS